MNRCLAICWLLAACSAYADLPKPRLDRLTPLGAAAGSTFEVEVAGANLEDARTLRFDHPGLKATFVKDRRFQVTVSADVPPGTYDARLLGRLGVSNPRLFSVSHALKDVTARNPDALSPQVISVNSAVNATCRGNREDIYRFTAKKGQRLVVECLASKLDSPMDAVLGLTNLEGKAFASSSGYHGRDPLIDLLAPEDGDFLITLHDLSYRGGHPYRLILSDRPHASTVFPRAVQIGKDVELTVLGRNLGPGAKKSIWSEFDLPLDEAKLTIKPPADVFDLGAYRFLEHPTDHSVSPTAATCTLRGFQVRPRLGDLVANAHALLLVDTPVTLEAEPNDAADRAQRLTLPAVVSGRFDKPRDVDWFEFETVEAGRYTFDVYCERIRGGADPYLVVTDHKGNRVVELDDFGHRVKAFDGHLRDPSGQANLTAKTRYRVLVQDRYGRGGARLQYVLKVSRSAPDFFVAAIHSENPGPAGATVRAGSAIYLDLVLHRSGDFNGPVIVSAEGLPPGVHAQPMTVYGTHGVFVLSADLGAKEWDGTIKLFATAKIGDATLRREVRPYTRVWTDANPGSSRPTRELALAVRESGPFELQFADQRLEVQSGQKATLKCRLRRNWQGFDGRVAILPLTPTGPRMQTSEIPAGKDEATITIDINSAPGEYTWTVLGQAQVPYAKDPRSGQKSNTLVSIPARPITLVVTAKK